MIAIRFLATILTYLISCCGILPLFQWLTTVPRVALLCGLILGIWQDINGSRYVKPWMQTTIIIPAFWFYLLQLSYANPVQPVVSVLAIMLAVRIGGDKSVRYSLQIYVLAIFCLAASSLFNLSPIFLVYLGSLLFMVAIALVFLTFLSQNSTLSVTLKDLKRIVVFGLSMPILAVPLLVLLFPILPRTQMPLWHFMIPLSTRTTGYSDTVEPGSQSSITESRTLAFRAEMPHLAQLQPYWRGTVFNRIEGNKWIRLKDIPDEPIEFSGKTIHQEIFMEPSVMRTLLALDRPETITQRHTTKTPDGVIEYSGILGRRLNYSAESLINIPVVNLNEDDKQFYLQVPNHLSDKIVQLAAEIKGTGETERARVAFLENYFRTGGYRYATHGLATGDDAIEQFLFVKKQGHCEYFASSFALLLRAAGVPCRLVGGYYGGEYNRLGGYYLVTDDKAHVWVEVYFEDSGWVRVDPSSFAVNSREVWSARAEQSLFQRVAMTFDSLNHAWNRSVITYDFEQQMNVAGQVVSGLQKFNTIALLHSCLPYLAACLLLGGALYIGRRTLLFHPREQQILNSFLNVVDQKYQISVRKNGLGLFETAITLNNRHVTDFVAIYAGAVYRDRSLTDKEFLRLRYLLKELQSEQVKIT